MTKLLLPYFEFWPIAWEKEDISYF